MSTPPVLVIGSGPAGLAVAACLVQRGIGVRLVDRHGAMGGAYTRMYAPLVLSSLSRYLDLPDRALQASGPYTRASEYAAYLADYGRRAGLVVEQRCVTRLEAAEDGIGYWADFDSRSRSARARFVVVATGMCDHPVIPDGIELEAGGPTMPEVLHSRDWRGIQAHRTKRVLIVGSGMRAVELAEECASAGARVVMSTRRRVVAYPRKIFGLDLRHVTFPLLRRLPRFFVRQRCRSGWRFPGIDDSFGSLLASRRIQVRGPLARLDAGTAVFADASPSWSPDLVVLATGYRFELPFLSADLPRSEQGYPLVEHGESPRLPDLFFLGFPCTHGADSQFLHGMARDARTIAATIARRLNLPRRSVPRPRGPSHTPASPSSSWVSSETT